jgi:hypothetical protein
MVTKSKKITGEKEQKKGRVKVGELKLNKETVKDLTGDEARRIKGGAATGSRICGDTTVAIASRICGDTTVA